MEKKFYTLFRNSDPFSNIFVYNSQSSTTTFWQSTAICATMEGRLYLPKIFFQLFTTTRRLSQNFSRIDTMELATHIGSLRSGISRNFIGVRSAPLLLRSNSLVRFKRTLAHFPIQGGRKLPCKHARFARESLRGANFRVAIAMVSFSRTGDNNGGEMA